MGQRATRMSKSPLATRVLDPQDKARRSKGGAPVETEKLPQLLSLIPVAFYTCDTDGRIIYYNKRAVELWGCEPQLNNPEQRFCACHKVLRPDGRFMAPEDGPIATALRTGKPVPDLEAMVERPDGSRICVLINTEILRDEKGKVSGAVNVFQDITNLKMAIEAGTLQQNEHLSGKIAEALPNLVSTDASERRRAEEGAARLAAIVEHSKDAIISKDLNGIIKSWNRGAEQLFGYTASEAIGRSVTILIPEGYLNEEPEILQRIRHGESIENYETIRRRKDGMLLDISLTVSPVKDNKGNIIGASKVARDITDKARAKEKLEQTVAERTASLREAIAQMEEFSYTVSHDLRAPLRSMKVYSETLLEEFSASLPDDARYCVERIAVNAKQLDKMVLDVLTFSRVARADFHLEKVAVDKLVRQIVEQYPAMHPPQAQIQIDPLPDVLGHEPSLIQAFSNLLNNAVKFVPAGRKPSVRIWGVKSNGVVRFWVADNGIGVDPKYHHRLFSMFERIHPNLKVEGTGVGLAIVRKAVERMGGRVGVESDGVNGSKFWIEVRAAEQL